MHASIVVFQALEKVGMSDKKEICGRHGFAVVIQLRTVDHHDFSRIALNCRI